MDLRWQQIAKGGEHAKAAMLTASGTHVKPCEDVMYGDKNVSVMSPGEEVQEEEEEGWWQQRVWPERGTTPGNEEQIPSTDSGDPK